MPDSLHPLLPDGLPVEWLHKAACRGSGLTIDEFFPPPSHTLRREVAEMCNTCPVRVECLRWAYDQNLTSGWFGGVSAGMRERHSFEELRERIETGDDSSGASNDAASEAA